jgi:hypothetical protein
MDAKPGGATLARQLFAAALIVIATAPSSAQSGRGLMHGYVAFEDVSYNEMSDGKVHARVELRADSKYSQGAYTAETDTHGSYDFKSIGMGEYILRITSPGYEPYETRLYIPSDFECRLATMLKKVKAKTGRADSR